MGEGEMAPDGAMVTCEVRVVQYINPESGELWWNLDWTHDAPLTQVIGLLEIGKAQILRRAQEEDE